MVHRVGRAHRHAVELQLLVLGQLDDLLEPLPAQQLARASRHDGERPAQLPERRHVEMVVVHV